VHAIRNFVAVTIKYIYEKYQLYRPKTHTTKLRKRLLELCGIGS
jgi:hypothetical protein